MGWAGANCDAGGRVGAPASDGIALAEIRGEQLMGASPAGGAFNWHVLFSLRSFRRCLLQLPFELDDALFETLHVTCRRLSSWGADDGAVVPPPVQADLLGLVDGAHQQPDPDVDVRDVRRRE